MSIKEKCSFVSLTLIIPLTLSILLFSCARISPPPVSELEQGLRISPQAAYQSVKEGKAVLVCAYYDERICRRIHVDNALPYPEFERNLRSGNIPPDKEIIFYCA